MRKNTVLSLLLGVAVSAAAFYFAFRNVPLAELLAYMADIELSWMVIAVLVAAVSFVLRAFRWQLILGRESGIGFWQAYHPLMIGFMLNCILPGRIGEMARPVIVRQRHALPFSTGVATVAAERAFDLMMLMGLFALVIATVDIDPDLDVPFGGYHLNRETLMTVAGSMVKLSLVLIAGIVMIGFARSRNWIKRTIMAAPAVFFFAGKSARRWIAQRVCLPLTGLVETFAAGFEQVKRPGSLLACAALTAAIWSLAALSYHAMAMGSPGIDLTYLEITAMMVIICFFIALPSVPGFWGIWEAGGVFSLYLFGVVGKNAAGYTLANHAVQILPVVLLGIGSAVAIGIDIRKIAGPEKNGSK